MQPLEQRLAEQRLAAAGLAAKVAERNRIAH